jgi:hypothetical protein
LTPPHWPAAFDCAAFAVTIASPPFAAVIAFVVLLFFVAFFELLLEAMHVLRRLRQRSSWSSGLIERHRPRSGKSRPLARSAYPILAKNLPALVPHQPLTLS